MHSNIAEKAPATPAVWVVSKGRYVQIDLTSAFEGVRPGPVVEYRISDLARYLMSPDPVEIQRRLVGCEIHYHESTSQKLGRSLRRFLRRNRSQSAKQGAAAAEVLINREDTRIPRAKDDLLQDYLCQLQGLLRAYDPVLKRLSMIHPARISDIIGLCEDAGGNRSKLKLAGAAEDKIAYVVSALYRAVAVNLEKAYVGEGLFELGGFDFEHFERQNTHRLLRFVQHAAPRACVLAPDNTIAYIVDNPQLVPHMQLLEQAIRTNPKMGEALLLCAKGQATPLQLFFTRKVGIDYSESYLPELYRKFIQNCQLGLSQRDALISSLNTHQVGIAFSYVPRSAVGKEVLYTNLSVMHDLKALDPIKENLPQIYSEINKRTFASEAGRFYLLDSIRGFRNGQ